MLAVFREFLLKGAVYVWDYMLEIPRMITIIVTMLQFLIVTFNNYNNNFNHMWNF
jgi:hypothetical protein